MEVPSWRALAGRRLSQHPPLCMALITCHRECMKSPKGGTGKGLPRSGADCLNQSPQQLLLQGWSSGPYLEVVCVSACCRVAQTASTSLSSNRKLTSRLVGCTFTST